MLFDENDVIVVVRNDLMYQSVEVYETAHRECYSEASPEDGQLRRAI